MNNKVELEVLVRQFIGLFLAESHGVGGFVYIFLAPSVGNGRSQRRYWQIPGLVGLLGPHRESPGVTKAAPRSETKYSRNHLPLRSGCASALNLVRSPNGKSRCVSCEIEIFFSYKAEPMLRQCFDISEKATFAACLFKPSSLAVHES
jgi:hypothetical protein